MLVVEAKDADDRARGLVSSAQPRYENLLRSEPGVGAYVAEEIVVLLVEVLEVEEEDVVVPVDVLEGNEDVVVVVVALEDVKDEAEDEVDGEVVVVGVREVDVEVLDVLVELELLAPVVVELVLLVEELVLLEAVDDEPVLLEVMDEEPLLLDVVVVNTVAGDEEVVELGKVVTVVKFNRTLALEVSTWYIVKRLGPPHYSRASALQSMLHPVAASVIPATLAEPALIVLPQ
ncbi:MAG: hypothetical protein Q9226_003931 [Calogaya cf. arnoldii]